MQIFFTSDTHFGHDNIIRTCARPFANAADMDEALISRWNSVINPGDTVYHLGDFCYRNACGADRYVAELNGEIHLIAGNHDARTLAENAKMFASVNVIREINAGGKHIVLCHYPMREWHGAWRGAWHLFGHVHGRLNEQPHGFSLDVGVDSHDFRPWSLDEITDLFKERINPFSGKRTGSPTPIAQ